VFKLDYALDAPIPWQAEGVDRAPTVHLGGTFEEINQAESGVWRGEHSEKPYVLLAQHCKFDPGRAPDGKHTLWAYCHVPNGSTKDMSAQIENQ
ncbi:FAD-dependent oxidoreductase, partial [Acinetobacter baumannii]